MLKDAALLAASCRSTVAVDGGRKADMLSISWRNAELPCVLPDAACCELPQHCCGAVVQLAAVCDHMITPCAHTTHPQQACVLRVSAQPHSLFAVKTPPAQPEQPSPVDWSYSGACLH